MASASMVRPMEIFVVEIRPFELRDEAAVIALWERCELTRPWNNPGKDIRRKLRVRPDLFLVGDFEGEMVATVMVGYEGHRGWINYLAVAPEHQRKGFGRMMMEEAERLLRQAGCPKVNLQVREENEVAVTFYQRLGYAVDQVISMGKRLEKDDGP
jgi:ribosomal protein S18 acetylase RimI-like enzyme